MKTTNKWVIEEVREILDEIFPMKEYQLIRFYFRLLTSKAYKYELFKEDLLPPADKKEYEKEIEEWRKKVKDGSRGRPKKKPPTRKYPVYEQLLYEFSNTQITDNGKEIKNPIGFEFLIDLGKDKKGNHYYKANPEIIYECLRCYSLSYSEFEKYKKAVDDIIEGRDKKGLEDFEKLKNQCTGTSTALEVLIPDLRLHLWFWDMVFLFIYSSKIIRDDIESGYNLINLLLNFKRGKYWNKPIDPEKFKFIAKKEFGFDPEKHSFIGWLRFCRWDQPFPLTGYNVNLEKPEEDIIKVESNIMNEYFSLFPIKKFVSPAC